MMMEDLASAQLSLAFDLVIAALLLATIAYAAILNRKLTRLRSAKDEMARLLHDFGKATLRAQDGLETLRAAGGEIGEALQRDITKGNALADDLMFLIERAGGLADRLEGALVRDRRKGAEGGSQAKAKTRDKTAASEKAGTEAADEEADKDGEASANSAFMETLRGIR